MGEEGRGREEGRVREGGREREEGERGKRGKRKREDREKREGLGDCPPPLLMLILCHTKDFEAVQSESLTHAY